jgi:hypothetical protein
MTVHSEQDRIAAALDQLAADQWVITPVPGMVIIATRRWSDESVDTVLILSPENTYGRRDDSAKRFVWRTKGSVEAVLRAAQDLPSPGAQDAPREPISDGSPDGWV